MQRTKSKILSILLSLVMLLSLLPTTALAAGNPDPTAVFVDGNKDFSSGLYYKNNDTAGSFSGSDTDYNAHYDSATGTLTLNGYDGGRITLGGASDRDLTIKLIGNNTVTVDSEAGIVATSNGCNIIITAESGSSGKLTIKAETSGSGDVYGIGTGLASGAVSGNVTIKGHADVTINATTDGSTAHSFGIYAGEVAIKDSAKVAISAKAPKTTENDSVNGIYAKTKVTIDTDNEITVDVSNDEAGASVYSTGVNSMNNLTLTKVGRMTVKWNGNYGAPFYPDPIASISDTHAVNVDKTNRYASYRYGTPRTVEVVNGTVTGPGVPNATDSGKFLENDTVNIKPYEPKGKSGEKIPFKGWTSSDVMLSSPTTAANSFTVPNKDVTVTAKHNPFDGAPTFKPTGDTGTTGTLTFKTKVKLGDGTEAFYLAKDGEQNDESKYIDFRTDTSNSTSPYEYSYETNSLSGVNKVEAGNYYVVELLNGTYYLSDKFTVNYAAPTAGISVSGTIKSYNPNNATTIQLMRGGTEQYKTTIAKTTASGQVAQNFSFSAVAPGTYDLVVTKAAHLSYTVKNVKVGDTDLDLTKHSNAAISTITLLCGDIAKNGYIDFADYQELLSPANYGKKTTDTGVNALADLNGNGYIDFADYQILLSSQHYGKSAVSVNFGE